MAKLGAVKVRTSAAERVESGDQPVAAFLALLKILQRLHMLAFSDLDTFDDRWVNGV